MTNFSLKLNVAPQPLKPKSWDASQMKALVAPISQMVLVLLSHVGVRRESDKRARTVQFRLTLSPTVRQLFCFWSAMSGDAEVVTKQRCPRSCQPPICRRSHLRTSRPRGGWRYSTSWVPICCCCIFYVWNLYKKLHLLTKRAQTCGQNKIPTL